VGTLVLLGIGSFLIGQRQFLFSSMYAVQTQFKTVQGLIEGAEVRVGGVQEGVVKRIEIPRSADGLVTVFMRLDRSTKSAIRSDSVASIGSEGLLGNKFVEISFGTADAPPVSPGQTLASIPPSDMNELMRKADDILDSTNDAMVSVEASARSLQDISAKIDAGRGTMGALVNDRSVYDQINKATAQASSGAAAFSDDMEALKHNFLLRGYFDQRGYEDEAMLTDHLVARLPEATPLKTFSYDAHKMFTDADHAKLRDEHALDDAGRYLERYPFGVAVVVAASGAKGDSASLRTLLEARAAVVRDYLVKHFKMNDDRVKTMELGKTPEITNDMGTIDVVIYPTGVTK